MAVNAASYTMFVEINSQRIPLDMGQLYLLGKHNEERLNKANNFIKLEAEEDVDAKHCIIEVGHSDDVYVYDLFSLKGTMVNSSPLKGLEKLRLKNGDILKVGQQEIKFLHDQQEVSHDSSGFLEVNKNTSDIIPSSPDSTSQHESRIRRENHNNFLVPALPAKKSMTPNNSLVIPETEAANRISLNASTNSRQSDSFTIPETQYCRARNSLNASDLSIAESNPDVSGNKIKFNFGNLDDFNNDDDDDFCIPETQEVLPAVGGITSRQSARLSEVKEKSVRLEESTKKDNGDDSDDIDGSQFRICTQDYNEGFGEEADQNLHSQIIPIIRHHTVILNATAKSCNENENSKNRSQLEEADKEMSLVKWSNLKVDQETTALRADCSTPDIFEFEGLEQDNAANAKEQENVAKTSVVAALQMPDEDEEDLMPTQRFLPSAPIKTVENKNEHDKACVEKEYEEVLTLSDKENRCPVALEPITDLPPTQLIDVPSTARSNTSSTSRNSFTTPANENKNNSKSLLDIDIDEEDDLLTQAFLQPSNAPSSSAAANHKNMPVKCFNSTVLEDKLNVKNPATFFAELEKTPLKTKTSPASNFKIPVLKKISSASSATSETDLDLLMCTPQLIKQHLDPTEDLKKNILAVKNKHLFGEDTDEEAEKEEDDDDDQSDLVKLINIPKDSLDFDKLLPHLKNEPQAQNKLSKEQEAQKVYRFNISFGKEQDKNQAKCAQSKSSTVSRDERHAARDKERELAERKGRSKTKDSSRNHSKDNSMEKSLEKKTKQKETKTKKAKEHDEQDSFTKETDKPKSRTKHKQDEAKSSTIQDQEEQKSVTKQVEEKKPKSSTKKEQDEQKSSTKQEKSTRLRKRNASSDTTESSAKTTKKEEQPKEMPARRMTRAKSRHEEKPTTSKEAAVSKSTKTKSEEGDELDSIATQPFEEDDLDSIATQPYEDDLNVVSDLPLVRLTRCRTTSKQSESQDSITSNTSSRRTAQRSKSKNDSSLSHNTSADGNITTKTTGERKRKAEATAPVIPEKIERKRLRSTHSQDSTTTKTSSQAITNTIWISMTMVDPELFKNFVKNSKGFWNVAKNPADCEVLVMDKAFRTFKFLLAMSRGIPIVTSEYLKKLNESQTPKKVRINDYLFKDEEFEKKHKFSLVKSLQMAKKHKLFKDYEFVMTNSILPNPEEIKAIIEASGGYVHDKNPPAAKDNQQIYLVSAKEDKKEWHKYRRLNKNITIVSTEAIMSSIMRQTCERLNCYTLS